MSQRHLAALLLTMLVLAGCPDPSAWVTVSPLSTPTSIGGTALSFETIEMGQPVASEKTWNDEAPGLLIIADFADIEAASQYLSDEAISSLKKLDFTQYLALIAFDGWKSELNYDFQIQQIVRRKDQVSVIAQPGRLRGPAAAGVISSLHHLVKIHKDGVWGQDITFKLYFNSNNQQDVATASHYIP